MRGCRVRPNETQVPLGVKRVHRSVDGGATIRVGAREGCATEDHPMNTQLALSLAKEIVDPSIPLPERAQLARIVRGSVAARLVGALVIALLAQQNDL